MTTDHIANDVRRALAEDIGGGDLTAQLLPESLQGSARILCRESAVLCGQQWFNEVFQQVNSRISISWRFKDGDHLSAGDVVCELKGNARSLLTGERTALNFLQTLSATATLCRRYADAVKGSSTMILDTRKTLPGLRLAQKYAVRCGGCENHRMGLYDAILIKENHIAAAGSISQALKQALSLAGPDTLVEIEVESTHQLTEALDNGAKRVLLDNFSVSDIASAVTINDQRALLEASGGITLDNIKAVAATGVDFISIGALTKHIHAVDFSMQLDTV